MFEFDDLERALQRIDVDIGAAEAHGIVCGVLCVPNGQSTDWVTEITGPTEPGDLLSAECTSSLLGLCAETQKQLSSDDCDFRPLLPDDDEPLGLRSEALGLWCSGFLLGFTIGGITDLQHLPADSREVIDDLNQFAGIQTSTVEDEAEEAAYAELVEYIRVGVMLVNEELHATGQPGPGQKMH